MINLTDILSVGKASIAMFELPRGMQVSRIFPWASDALLLLGNNYWFQMTKTGSAE